MTARSRLTLSGLSLSLGIGAGLLTVACGGSNLAPKELIDARASYERVAKGQTTQLAPAELDSAKQSLAKAEGSFSEDGDSVATRDLAYVADRKALAAESQANIVEAERQRAALEKDLKQTQLESIDKAKSDLEKEKLARADAEKRAQAAMASLAEIGKVKEEARGVVITLSGSVLFATGKSDLLPIAKDKLNDVAKALSDQGFKEILVEGHTDSRGNAQQNEELSLKRAESVRTLLISQGLPPEKVKAQGLGSSRPVADNNTAEGRANNRRVEIVVSPLK
jgi:outer membrane protein OmpA-like peptidoglycan-associated protein